MKQKDFTFTYTLDEMPDISRPENRIKAGGNAAVAMFESAAQNLRILSEFPPGSVTAKLRFVYEPTDNVQARQSRLKIYLTFQARDEDTAKCLSLLAEQGPMSQFYKLQKCQRPPVAWHKFNASCDITRRPSISEPTIKPEFNSRALPYYFMVDPFEPDHGNDFMQLDSMLDSLTEPAVVEICIESTDISNIASRFVKCMSRYQSINRTWDNDDDNVISSDYRNDGQDWSTAVKLQRQKEPLIEDVVRRGRKTNETLSKRHVKFSIRTFAKDKATARLLGSIVAESAYKNGQYQLFDSVRGKDFFDRLMQYPDRPKVTTPPVFESLATGRDTNLYKDISRLCSIAPVDELSSIFRLPVASPLRTPSCIRNDTSPLTIAEKDMLVIGHENIGFGGKKGIARGILLNNLSKGCSIFGLPGGGKSILVTYIMQQLCWRNIPFALFEGAKREYRRLKLLKKSRNKFARKLAKKLKLFTPGSDISPYNFNPLKIPKGITLCEHIELLLSCFKAAIPMEGSMLALLGEALEMVYEDHPDPDQPPTMSDMHNAIKKILRSKKYDGELKNNLDEAINTRFGQMTKRAMGDVFKCGFDVPDMTEILNSCSIFEMAGLPGEIGCLFMMFMLTIICETLKATPWDGKGVRFAIILEEAHVFLGSTSDAVANQFNADPRAFASDLICRMLAEFRSLGVAIFITDQLPSAVSPQIIKNTCSKIVFRQVDNFDRQVIGGSMLFDEVDMSQIARLRPGQAYFHTEGYFAPLTLTTVNLQDEWNIPLPPVSDAILPFISDEKWFIQTSEKRIVIEEQHFRKALDGFKISQNQLRRAVIDIRRRHIKLLELTDTSKKNKQFILLCQEAKKLYEKIEESLKDFRRTNYRFFVINERHDDIVSDDLKSRRSLQLRRFKTICRRNSDCIRVLDNLINECSKINQY